MARDTTEAVHAIGVGEAALNATCPDAAGAIIDQHGFNLFWVNFAPGTVMTIFSATATALTAWVWFSNGGRAASPAPVVAG